MENYEFKDIKEMSSKVSELPNSELIKIMEILSTEFDNTKNNIISMSYHLDDLESTYTSILTEYQKRTNG